MPTFNERSYIVHITNAEFLYHYRNNFTATAYNNTQGISLPTIKICLHNSNKYAVAIFS